MYIQNTNSKSVYWNICYFALSKKKITERRTDKFRFRLKRAAKNKINKNVTLNNWRWTKIEIHTWLVFKFVFGFFCIESTKNKKIEIFIKFSSIFIQTHCTIYISPIYSLHTLRIVETVLNLLLSFVPLLFIFHVLSFFASSVFVLRALFIFAHCYCCLFFFTYEIGNVIYFGFKFVTEVLLKKQVFFFLLLFFYSVGTFISFGAVHCSVACCIWILLLIRKTYDI